MGIVNVTPDSFSDGGEFLDPERAIAHGRELASEGADVLDVGGESTRPGSEGVSAEEELSRVLPVVRELAGAPSPAGAPGSAGAPGHAGARIPAGAHGPAGAGENGDARGRLRPIPVSVDTSKLAVAEAALEAGAAIVNDVTALRAEPDLAGLCADRGCGLVLMHMLGEPRTMQENPTYDDVVDDIKSFLAERIEFAVSEGVSEERIWVDPGIGFGKTVEHNLELHRRLGELRELGRPIVFGSSRKSFIGKLTGAAVEDRLGGTIASNVIAAANGAAVLRVHDVAPLRQALTVAEAILDPARAAAVGERE